MAGCRCVLRLTALLLLVIFMAAHSQVLADEIDIGDIEQLSDTEPREIGECPNFFMYSPYYHEMVPYIDSLEKLSNPREVDIDVPIILWWTPFTKEPGTFKRCGKLKCYFTEDRRLRTFPNIKAYMFYGTDFKYLDLPLPRTPGDYWALLHEESPHNVWMFSHLPAISLFNYTATFRRESDYNIATQYLSEIEELEMQDFLVPTPEKSRLVREEGLALVNYVQSDCGALSDRDHLVQMLQRHINVDSYGACEHNKDLPQHLRDPLQGMIHEEFLKLVAKYKFTLALENGVCDDYMTEKFWRPFVVGSVPIVFGSSKAKDFFPTNKSAIFVQDFENIDDLVAMIKRLDENETEYEEYLSFKTPGGVTNQFLRETIESREWDIGDHWESGKPSFIDGYQCYICKQLHKADSQRKQGSMPVRVATIDHYGCPEPRQFSDVPPGNLTRVSSSYWSSAWLTGKYMAMAVRHFIENNITSYTEKQFMDKTIELYNENELQPVSGHTVHGI